jgi:hypothetical protein
MVIVMMMVHLELLRWVAVWYESLEVKTNWQSASSFLHDSPSAQKGINNKQERLREDTYRLAHCI